MIDPSLTKSYLQHPAPKPSPEQTASLLSLLLYSWLDKTILNACYTDHLKLDQLPPLADYDEAHFLAKQSFPVCSRSMCDWEADSAPE